MFLHVLGDCGLHKPSVDGDRFYRRKGWDSVRLRLRAAAHQPCDSRDVLAMAHKTRLRSLTRKGGLTLVPMAWYEPEEYSRFLEIMGHPDGQTRSFERWHEVAKSEERSLKRSGCFVVRVVIHPDEFADWCAVQGVQPNGYSLGTFVRERGDGTWRRSTRG